MLSMCTFEGGEPVCKLATIKTTMVNQHINYKGSKIRQIQDEFNVKINYLNSIWKYFDWEKVNFNKWKEQNITAETDPSVKKDIERTEYNVNLLYPHNFLSTNFSQFYTILERSLGFLCEDIVKRRNIELDPAEELKIKQTKDNFLLLKFLLKKIDLSVSDFDPQYHEIRNFQKLRNSIAHDGDSIVLTQPDDSAFRGFLGRMDGIIIQNRFWVQEGGLDFYLMISDYPTKRFHTVSLEFFSRLLEAVYPSDEHKLWED